MVTAACRGLDGFQRFYGKVRDYYDFSTWKLIDVLGDGDIVFSTSEVRVAGTTLVDVRVFICDAPAGEGGGR